MAEKISVTGGQAKSFLKRFKELEGQFEKRPEEILEGMQLLIGGGDWLGEILTKERQCHKTFFGARFNLDEFRKTLQEYGRKRIREWQILGLESHYLPEVEMSQDQVLSGWKIKPEKWFYEQVAKGKVLRQQHGKLVLETEIRLEGITVLIDTRLKPAYRNGKQMYKNDNLLGPIIEKLRKDERITGFDYGSLSSRFGVSADELEKEIKPTLAKLLGLDISQVRLERAIEANVIPQLYPHMPRKDDGKTNTWVWYEEFFREDHDLDHLAGGNSRYGGLANVYYCLWSDDRQYGSSIRPLAVL